MSGIVLLHDLDGLRAQVREWKRQGLRVGIVPTMGILHEGHFSLVRLAREHADRVVASVFVNPTQFGPNEDFSRYPRTPGQDAAGLQAAGCDALWMPSVDAMYPYGAGNAVRIHVPGITDTLDGAHRPGHFDGVATVVARLFNQVPARRATRSRRTPKRPCARRGSRRITRWSGAPISVRRTPMARARSGSRWSRPGWAGPG